MSPHLVTVHGSLLLPDLSPPGARGRPPLCPPELQAPPRRLQAGLPPQSPPGQRGAGRPDVLQGGTSCQSGVIVGRPVGADVVVLVRHLAVPAVGGDMNTSSQHSPVLSPLSSHHIKSCFPGKKSGKPIDHFKFPTVANDFIKSLKVANFSL